MPKHRLLKNRDLVGTNIKAQSRSSYTDYYYEMPDGKLEPLGKDRKLAIETAIILNQALRPSGNIADRIINKSKSPAPRLNNAEPLDSLNKLIDKFQNHHLPSKHKPKDGKPSRTLEEKNYKLTKYREKWGKRSIDSITTNEIANFLDEHSEHSYIKHRALLEELFAYVIHQGLRTDNPVTVTMRKTEPPRERERHTIEGYLKIHHIAPDWLKRAMDIALRSIQRRGDLTRLHRDQVNLAENTIEIAQEKTKGYKHPVHIKIKMGEELRSAVEACLNSGIPCPYIIHYRPARLTKEIREAKLHPFAVTDEYLSKQFAKARDESGAYHAIPKNKRPTWHDLRALGMYLYKLAGYPSEYIQVLAGHASKEMTDHYISGHEKPIAITVSADLKLR